MTNSARLKAGADVPKTARPFVLLDDSLSPDGRCRFYAAPERIIRCDAPDGLAAALADMEAALAGGLHLAGFFAYELGYLFEPCLAAGFVRPPSLEDRRAATRAPAAGYVRPLSLEDRRAATRAPAARLPAARAQPLLWLGAFRGFEELPSADAVALLHSETGAAVQDLRLAQDLDSYLAKFRRVKDYIAAGDVYQVNLTFPYRFHVAGDPIALYGELRRRQRVAHGALVAAEDFTVLSFSPERFLRCRDGVAEMRPMKGTMARGRTREEDAANAARLRADEKSRAENLMILDLMRNDLGRVAETGSVAVTDMFTVETYRTLLQMTSGVTARLRPGIGPGIGMAALLRPIFPCGSVTGAPKIRAMEIIRELEDAPRGVYTGSIGALGPDGSVDLNVAIRTLFVAGDGAGEMGIGSGIVHDSDGLAEYEECLLKASFLTAADAPFRLIETMRWERGQGYALLEAHLARLAESAAYFGFPCDAARVRTVLGEHAAAFAAPLQRVRLTLDEAGDVEVTAAAIEPAGPDTVLRYVIAAERTASADRFLFHKTTRRQLYDGTRARLAAETGCDEVLFLNERGELTEGSFTNLFVERGGLLLTPPVSCGLLDGTLRRALLADPARPAAEAVLYPDDLRTADCVYLGNSVRGLIRAEMLAFPQAAGVR